MKSKRRDFLGGALLGTAGAALGQERDWSGRVPVRYPDADIVVLDKRFESTARHTSIQRSHVCCGGGSRLNAVGRYLL